MLTVFGCRNSEELMASMSFHRGSFLGQLEQERWLVACCARKVQLKFYMCLRNTLDMRNPFSDAFWRDACIVTSHDHSERVS